MGFFDLFRPLKKKSTKTWKEFGGYNSTFTVWNGSAFNSSVVRSCIRPLADFTSKAYATCTDKRIEKILNERPNLYMNGKDFLYKVRTMVELNNNCFIYIQRDDRARIVGFYPVPYSWFEALEYSGKLFIKFHMSDGMRTLTFPWDDLCVIRKDYNKSDIAGDDNNAILDTLDMMQTTNEGLKNSIKATANLRGILKSTKAMLAPDDIKRQKDEFVKDYLNLENEGGIASLDSTQEFTPITMNPLTASYEQMKEIRENIYRYFGVNDEVIMSNIETEKLENFYRLRIEPFLVALSRELTSKVYPGKASSYGNEIVFRAENGQFMTMSQKIDLFNKVVLYNGMLIDEWRALLGLGHIEGGDKPIMRLDAAPIDSPKFTDPNGTGQQPEKEEEEEEND